MDSQERIIRDIGRLRRERGALILAHNYQRGEIQDIADRVGDSLELARIAAREESARCIVFCGVSFMAETAAILRPERPVYEPEPNAGCPLADMITPRELEELRAKHPEAAVVAYVNTSAEVKALSDLCCTSANATEVVRRVEPGRGVIFIPDRHLGDWVRRQTGRGDMIIWRGYCPTHNRILPEHVERARAAHPGAPVVVHPECRPQVCEVADQVASTGGMLRYCKESPAGQFLIGTEVGMLHRLAGEMPEKRFWPVTELADCPDMKLVTLEKLLWELTDLAHPVRLAPEIIERARRPIERMVEVLGS